MCCRSASVSLRLATITAGILMRKASVPIRDVRIPKCCVRISPRILTTDPHPRPRPQADAVSDPLSVRESATRFLILTHVGHGLSTLRRVLRRICRGHKSKVMLPTAVNRSRKNSNASTWIISNSFFKSRVQSVHMNIRPIIRMQVFSPHGYLFTAAWCCEGMKTKASTELLDNWQRRFSVSQAPCLRCWKRVRC